jgi:hypothetical protein
LFFFMSCILPCLQFRVADCGGHRKDLVNSGAV